MESKVWTARKPAIDAAARSLQPETIYPCSVTKSLAKNSEFTQQRTSHIALKDRKIANRSAPHIKDEILSYERRSLGCAANRWLIDLFAMGNIPSTFLEVVGI
jgi:hypothetical protein